MNYQGTLNKLNRQLNNDKITINEYLKQTKQAKQKAVNNELIKLLMKGCR